jgi:uncharacterized protein YcaQ
LRILRGVERLGLLQIDSVNVLARAHYLPLFSRLGAYDRKRLDALSVRPGRALFEYWAHEASLIPMIDQPLFRWRMARADQGEGVWGRLKPFAGERRGEAMALLARIRDAGPLSASDLEGGAGRPGWWEWSAGKSALEWLFWTGRIAAAGRRPSFERIYDLSERALPRRVLDLATPPEAEAHRALLKKAARALGVASAAELRDYYRLPAAETPARLQELLDAGDLYGVTAAGEGRALYLSADAPPPRPGRAAALLAPFDPLIWERGRAERLFGLRYRIEIYTPAHRRVHGYYVLPFLLGERFVARVDLKAERPTGRLLVRAAHGEADAPAHAPEALAGELRALASWLGLGEVEVEDRGDLAAALKMALGAGRR